MLSRLRRYGIAAFSFAALFSLFVRCAAAQPVPADPSSEEVQSFAAAIDVGLDGGITVTERIDYYFPSARHGIYRDIPVRYDVDGKTVVVPVSVLGVSSANGGSVRYAVQKNGDYLRIRIGDPNVTVTGAQTYAIRYSAVGALRYFDDHDELYWNVTGNAWEVPLRRVSATVRLPDAVPHDAIKTRCYTGAQGSTAQDCVAGVQATTASFAANDAMTVVVGWPPGLVAKVLPKGPGFLDLVFPYVPLLIPVAVICLMWLLWWTRGRDPEGRGTLVVQYDPPPGLTPAEVGVMIDEDAGLKDVSGIIVDLAVRGYLKIREVEKQGLLLKSKDYEFDRLKDFANDPALKPFETHLLTALFGADGTIARVSDIKEGHTFYADLPVIEQKLYDRLVADGYFPSDPSKVRAHYSAIGIALIIVVLFFVGPASVFAGGFGGNLALAIVLSGVAILIFSRFMPRKTDKGVEAFDQAVGFREYLDKAEKYRMQWQEKEGVFERFLPYAMVFGVVDKWTKAFEGMNVPPPRWYEGSSFGTGGFNPVVFYASLNAMNGAMSTAMTARPQSSGGSGFGGGGGGGFSGGGFGGGGGGSW